MRIAPALSSLSRFNGGRLRLGDLTANTGGIPGVVDAYENPPDPPRYVELPKHPAGLFGAVDFPYTIEQPHWTRNVKSWTGQTVLNVGGPKYSNDPFEYIRSALVDSDTARIDKWLHWYYETAGGQYSGGGYQYDSGAAKAVQDLNLANFKGILTDAGFVFFPITEQDAWQFYTDLGPYWIKGYNPSNNSFMSPMDMRGQRHPRSPDDMSRMMFGSSGTWGAKQLGIADPSTYTGQALMQVANPANWPVQNRLAPNGSPGNSPFPKFNLLGIYRINNPMWVYLLKSVSLFAGVWGLANLATALVSKIATSAAQTAAAAASETVSTETASAAATAASQAAASSVIDVLPEVVVTAAYAPSIAATTAALATGAAAATILPEILVQNVATPAVNPAVATSALAPISLAPSPSGPPTGSSTVMDEIVVQGTQTPAYVAPEIVGPLTAISVYPQIVDIAVKVPDPNINWGDDQGGGSLVKDALNTGGDILTAGSGLLPLLPILTGNKGGSDDGLPSNDTSVIPGVNDAAALFKKALPWLLILGSIVIVTKNKSKKEHQKARRRLVGHSLPTREKRTPYPFHGKNK